MFPKFILYLKQWIVSNLENFNSYAERILYKIYYE